MRHIAPGLTDTWNVRPARFAVLAALNGWKIERSGFVGKLYEKPELIGRVCLQPAAPNYGRDALLEDAARRGERLGQRSALCGQCPTGFCRKVQYRDTVGNPHLERNRRRSAAALLDFEERRVIAAGFEAGLGQHNVGERLRRREQQDSARQHEPIGAGPPHRTTGFLLILPTTFFILATQANVLTLDQSVALAKPWRHETLALPHFDRGCRRPRDDPFAWPRFRLVLPAFATVLSRQGCRRRPGSAGADSARPLRHPAHRRGLVRGCGVCARICARARPALADGTVAPVHSGAARGTLRGTHRRYRHHDAHD